ncbi:unnamed protein product [Tilletia controversa]|nr:unnamed protein product [Tilletia controversa]CAD6981964.1 unnamed protein product [Tilletia controversa]
MRSPTFSAVAAAAAALLASCPRLVSSSPSPTSLNILISNDDGLGSANIRALFTTLLEAGHNPIISAPLDNKSGTGGARRSPRVVDHEGEYGFAHRGDPAVGHESPGGKEKSDDRIWYVNSYPVSSVQVGLEQLAPTVFNGSQPDLVVAGPNEGSNLGLSYLVSGTYGAARYAVEQGIPAIAFSAGDSTHRPYTVIKGADDQAYVYARLATAFIERLTEGGKPFLPRNTGLNINFPSAITRDCTPGKEMYILTRLLGTIDPDPDACTCGQSHNRAGCKLPVEVDLSKNPDLGCAITISVFEPSQWSPDASATQQAAVLDRLQGILSCIA